MRTSQRVIEWNKARYDQEFDAELAVKLLLEETDELYSAPTRIDMLDAVGDIAFVAIGVFWKLGFTDHEIGIIMHQKDFGAMTSEEAFQWLNSIIAMAMGKEEVINKEHSFPVLIFASYALLLTALGTIRGLGMQYLFYDVLNAICDSNDTKVIKGKVAANIKANIVKGDNYISPTKRLLEIESHHKQLAKVKEGTAQ